MAAISDPIGPLWKLFDTTLETPESEIIRQLERFLRTRKGNLLFMPEYGVENPHQDKGNEEVVKTVKQDIDKFFGGFLKYHHYRIEMRKGQQLDPESFVIRISGENRALVLYPQSGWRLEIEKGGA